MASQTESADENLKLLAKVFETLSECTNELVEAGVEFEPEALDLALNQIGQRFFFANPGNLAWRKDQYQHWIQDAPDVSKSLVNRFNRGPVTKFEVALLFKAPPPA
jgi:hypothetical protein